MSEQKIIEIIEKELSYFRCCEDDIKFKDAIRGLIDLYNKEKEKNEELENQRKNGTLSDGFHTFNDLYYQRCVLFATICNSNSNISWKSKKHNDGKKCFDSDEWFIVGIDTPEGSYTYHYEMKYWDLFNVKELEKGKEWDGHTEKDVTRLFSLKADYINKDKIRERYEQLKHYDYIEIKELLKLLEE